jgi:murein DD-endopeptidase MepM/ murein hydrolase activator NlpD
MRWWATFAILVLLLLPADTAAARPTGPGPAGPALPGPAGPTAPEPDAPAGGYRWPLAGVPAVTRPFQPPPRPWLPGHRGVDLAGAPGVPVLAAGAGVVAFAGSVAGVGVVSIDHPGGLRTTYEPVTPLVAVGTRVVAGEPIGMLLPGHEGCPVAACLHWGLRRGGAYLDPLLLLGLARVRLYPVNVASSPGRAAASRSYSSARL